MAESGLHSARVGFALLSGLTGGVLFFEAPVAYEVRCDRSKGVCTFTEQRPGRSRVREANIALLSQAVVRAATPGWPDPRTGVWDVSQETGDELVGAYWSREEAEEAVRKVNAFLQNPTAGHVCRDEERPADRLDRWSAYPRGRDASVGTSGRSPRGGGRPRLLD
jgi:hypothetical protein